MTGEPIIRIQGLEKVYKMGVERIHALRGVSFDIQAGEFVAIMGASGSGKSTLMNILGCLDHPTGGSYELDGRPTHRLGAGALATVRNQRIGFIFQSFELLPKQSALKNVMLPMIYSSRYMFFARKRAKNALKRVGLADRVRHRPNQLSGGQRQRVAIARALVNEPAILLADEPTGNLDSATTAEIIDLFEQLHDEGQTIIIVTHEEEVAGHAQRIIRLRDGAIMSDHPTGADPIHREYLAAAARAAGARAASEAAADTPPSTDVAKPTSVARATPTTPTTPTPPTTPPTSPAVVPASPELKSRPRPGGAARQEAAR